MGPINGAACVGQQKNESWGGLGTAKRGTAVQQYSIRTFHKVGGRGHRVEVASNHVVSLLLQLCIPEQARERVSGGGN